MAGIGLMAVLAGGYFVLFRDGGPALQEDLVAVFPLENRTGDPDLDYLGPLAAEKIAEGLGWIGGSRLVASSRIEDALRNRVEGQTLQDVAGDLKAEGLWTGSYSIQGEILTLRVEAVATGTGERGFSVESSGQASDPTPILDDLQDRSAAGSLLASSGRVAVGSLPRMPTFGAAQSHLRGLSIMRAGDISGSLPYFQEAYEADTTFLQPLLNSEVVLSNLSRWAEVDSILAILDSRQNEMSRVQRLQFEYGVSARSGDWREVLRLRRLMADEDPDQWGGYGLAHMALLANHPGEALEAMEALPAEALDDQWLWFWEHLAWANHALGRDREAVEAAREGRERFPEFLLLRWREIQALAAMGQLEELRPLLAELERAEPDDYTTPGLVMSFVAMDLARFGHVDEAREVADRTIDWFRDRDPDGDPLTVATLLMLTDRPREAVDLLGPQVQEHPDDTQLRGSLGVALALAGDRDGARAEARWLEELDPTDLYGFNTYWRASITAHLDELDEAVRLLRQALDEGVSFEVFTTGTEFMPLWGYEPFEQLMAPRG
jgi:tetratricopeptide (TPR) repeat protein